MTNDQFGQLDLLLDLHLERLDEPQRSRLVAQLPHDPDLQAKSERLALKLAPLDLWSVPLAPSQLADRVLASVSAQPTGARDLRFPESGVVTYRPQPRFSLRELLAAAACLALLTTVAVPGLSALRDRSQLAVCAGHLGSIYQGTNLYQASFGGALPFAGHIPGGRWLFGGDDAGPQASNSRHLYLVAKLGFGAKPDDFVCPANRAGKPMPAKTMQNRGDFAAAQNLSYDSLNLAGPSPNLRPVAGIAYVSDANPLFVGGRFHRGVDPTTTNSPAHRGRTQNVLFTGGEVRRLDSPIYGVSRDNLWLAGDIRDYTGTETPTSDEDAFLVPGCPPSGQ